ncbi:EPIDERMAL PATTERNING FACTOR-like protein 4 [Nymphaea thermarum]|nr:EPIDERMAL PATTERNING FACTOR-like protein 4 [Nymphaea thermarum]
MAKTDQHQIQRLIEEGREESRRWQPSLLPHRISGSGGGSRDFRSKKRQLIGSWPPTCRAKCGGCAPCQAVHVPIQPGRSNPLEYYPEAWRCKCRNRLFLP